MGMAEDRRCLPGCSACPRSPRAEVARPGCCISLLYSSRPLLAASVWSVDCVTRTRYLPIPALTCRNATHLCAAGAAL